jgi:branched-chain amino acid transport system ATP-binding protein
VKGQSVSSAELAVAQPESEDALEVNSVSVRFGGVAALSNVSLRVHAGVVTGLIGPNGAGKTTLFNVVSGLQRPNHGEVYIDGRDVTRLGPHRRARLGLARTFQRLELFGTLSALDNVRVGLEARHRESDVDELDTAEKLLERVGVHARRDTQVGSLPTGTARLVELARALSISPKVLLLDEPCSGLDDSESEALGALLRGLAQEGRSILLVEHDTDLVLKICDHIYVLDFGEIIASGSPEVIRADPAVQAAYLGHLDAPETGPLS